MRKLRFKGLVQVHLVAKHQGQQLSALDCLFFLTTFHPMAQCLPPPWFPCLSTVFFPPISKFPVLGHAAIGRHTMLITKMNSKLKMQIKTGSRQPGEFFLVRSLEADYLPNHLALPGGESRPCGFLMTHLPGPV